MCNHITIQFACGHAADCKTEECECGVVEELTKFPGWSCEMCDRLPTQLTQFSCTCKYDVDVESWVGPRNTWDVMESRSSDDKFADPCNTSTWSDSESTNRSTDYSKYAALTTSTESSDRLLDPEDIYANAAAIVIVSESCDMALTGSLDPLESGNSDLADASVKNILPESITYAKVAARNPKPAFNTSEPASDTIVADRATLQTMNPEKVADWAANDGWTIYGQRIVEAKPGYTVADWTKVTNKHKGKALSEGFVNYKYGLRVTEQ